MTWPLRFQNSNWGANQFKGWWGHRPDMTGADVVKSMTQLVTATLNHGAVPYSAPAIGVNQYFSLVRPDWHPTIYLHPLINRALEKAWQWWRSPITLVPDGDMQSLTATSWTAIGATATKSTARTWGVGQRSLHVVNSIPPGGVTGAFFDVEPGRAFRVSAKAYAVSGTPNLLVTDSTSPTAVSLAQVTASPAVLNGWQEIQTTGFIPYTAGGGQIQVSLRGLEGTADIYWTDVQLVPELTTRLALPPWVTQWRTEEGEEALRIYRARNRMGTIGSWPARAYDLCLVDADDYQIIQTPSSLNPLEIEFARESFYTGFPLFVEARRPFADFGALVADTDVSGIPVRLAVAAAKELAAFERRELNDRLPMWQHDFVREQKRVASYLGQPPPDNRRGLSWQVWSG